MSLKQIQSDVSDIFEEPDRLWNTDKNSICTDTGNTVKIFTSANSHHGGFHMTHNRRQSKHATCIVAVSASGRKTPPFFIVSGKNVIIKWFDPLKSHEAGDRPELQLLRSKD